MSELSSFSTSYQKCQSAVNSLIDPGFSADQFLQWKFKSPNKYSWANTIVSGANRYEVACQGDYSSTAPFPTTYNGPNNTVASEWVNTANAATSYWAQRDRKSTRLNSSHSQISYAVFCLKKKKQPQKKYYYLSASPH